MSTVRVEVAPRMLEWARERSGVNPDDWPRRFPKVDQWLAGEVQPTLKQLQEFASKAHAPFGYLLLDEPPVEELPIADFRTIAEPDRHGPSVNLLDTIYACQARQEWYRQHQMLEGEDPVALVGSETTRSNPNQAAGRLADLLGWTSALRQSLRGWEAAVSTLRARIEQLGVLVMINGVVGANNGRRLDVDEFRGFALSDDIAPLIFVNGTDTKAGQVFTLVHELAHLLIGATGVSDGDAGSPNAPDTERWCNAVAAEVLVPRSDLRQGFNPETELVENLDRLAGIYRVSTLVVLIGLRDARLISAATFQREYPRELDRVLDLAQRRPASSGGNFYDTARVRVSDRFARAVVTSTLEGRTLYRDAGQLLGLRTQDQFQNMADRLGIG